jgi:hypothetical protein
LGPAELRQARAQAIDVETGMHSDVEQACDALRPELSGCVSEATKRLTYRRQVGFPQQGSGARTVAHPAGPPADEPAD